MGSSELRVCTWGGQKAGPITEQCELVTMMDHVLCRGQDRNRKTNLGVGAVLLLAFPTGEEGSGMMGRPNKPLSTLQTPLQAHSMHSGSSY
ncbi:hypothetical protein DV515_00010521 [Chloebia gouldiae]|uniref:Uncharacterized protein n=1 Tax=Chloebia gouldiae TaxID=44316 RepID=A0A3L8SA48_CHLGU|nr:hypothetical protein DV515_00010521 [Chloebia gouldiae]